MTLPPAEHTPAIKALQQTGWSTQLENMPDKENTQNEPQQPDSEQL
jgi:hypothetical protein